MYDFRGTHNDGLVYDVNLKNGKLVDDLGHKFSIEDFQTLYMKPEVFKKYILKTSTKKDKD